MISQISHGSDFGSLFRYLLAEDKQAQILGGFAAGRNAWELTQEFTNCADQRPTTTKPVKHIIIGFATDDGLVSDEVKSRVAQKAVEGLGYTYNQYVAVSHGRNDPGHDWNHHHDHIHIAVNMITIDGKRVDDWQDKRRLEPIIRQLEIQENLTTLAPSTERKFKALSMGQTQRIKREIKEYNSGERTTLPDIPLTCKLQAAIDQACHDRPDLTTFISRLQGLDIDVRPSKNAHGRYGYGISYRLGNVKIAGSKLHHASFPQLIDNRGVDFDPQRDREAIATASSGQPVIISSHKHITWSALDLTDYLPSALAHLFRQAQTKSQAERKQVEQIRDAANFILDRLGSTDGNTRTFDGNIYRLQRQDHRLTISLGANGSLLFDAQTKKGEIEYEIFELNPQQQQHLIHSAHALKLQQQQESSERSTTTRTKSRSL